MEFRLQDFLMKKGCTQKKLADDLKLSTSLVNQYVKNKCYPDYTMLCKIADYLNVTTDELLGRNNDILNLKFLSETEAYLIKKILKMNQLELDKTKAYVMGLTE